MSKPTDLNDLHQFAGPEAVKACIEAAAPVTGAPSSTSEISPDEWPPAIDLVELSKKPPTPPRHIIDGWLPEGYATLLSAHGGTGKSTIALHQAVCIALGHDFFGLPVERRKVKYLSCEDRGDVLHWRLARTCTYLGVSIADLDGWLGLLDLVGHDTILFQSANGDETHITAAYRHLAARIRREGYQVVYVDGISDTYNGNENARAEVKAFVNCLLATIPLDGAVVLIGHVAKLTAFTKTSTEGYSGSTSWHNSVRARWYLYPETKFGEEAAEKTGELLLELQKSNLGPTSGAMRFRWDDSTGMFVGHTERSEGPMDRNFREQEEREGILAAFMTCPDGHIPAASSGPRTAFHVLSVQPNFPSSLRAGKAEKKRFWRHMEELRAMGFIEESTITRSDRHKMRVLVPTDKACGHAGNDENEHSQHITRNPKCGHAGNAALGVIGDIYPAHGPGIPTFTESDFEGVTP
ncbi:AAA family ATPase [Pelobacter propionicus]|uniref:RecA-family ATPase-like protein n=1 Tax=Pelobacter propionicus (strain DSM 2379 / NBRC 103807 / OttBd1) TaxID=338966 RepID=A1AQW7_PELPD|nr:AAA family ATPase [Pelobacter propionicus]ABK99737.1 RecA-family ATPase-like protein [Pelobacter propionicus DSM 2379]